MPRALAIALVVWTAVLSTGGAAEARAAHPSIRSVECISSCADGRPRGGSLLLVSGTGLGQVYTAVFPGGRDGIRDLRGRAGQASTTTVRVRVPWEAASGTFVLGTRDGMVSRAQPVRIAPVPVVSRWRCLRQCAAGRRVRGGSLVLVRGVRLASVRDAVLNNGRGRADDMRARVSNQRFDSLRLRVPAKAVTGVFAARERRRRSPGRRIVVQPPAPVAISPGAAARVFPVRGAHTFGGAQSRFGAGRSGHTHQGQDVMAACGIPLVSATAGTVHYTGYQSSAGNYMVIRGTAPVQDYVYMHMQAPPALPKGTVVGAGQPVGAVGETGNAQGCHLHFEIWSAPGWYDGGKPLDPLPQLRAWEAAG